MKGKRTPGSDILKAAVRARQFDIPGAAYPFSTKTQAAKLACKTEPSLNMALAFFRLRNKPDITWAELIKPKDTTHCKTPEKKQKEAQEMQELLKALDARKKDIETP